jgi:hypothetical protein
MTISFDKLLITIVLVFSVYLLNVLLIQDIRAEAVVNVISQCVAESVIILSSGRE